MPKQARAKVPGPRAIGLLIALGAANSLWAVFLWRQLWVVHAGGEAFCLAGEAAGCAELWDSAFAAGVRAATGLPLAAWGVVWGALALAVSLALWMRRSELAPLPLGAALATAASGGLAVVVLAAVSVALGQLCSNCVVTYSGVALWSVILFSSAGALPVPVLLRGAGLAAGGVLLGWALALYPAIITPASSARVQAALLERLGESAGPMDVRLVEFVDGLSSPQRRRLADALHTWQAAQPTDARPTRALLGSRDAAVHMTEFTDTLCGHCASLHELLSELRRVMPGAFTLEERQFPLDRRCNPNAPTRVDPGSVRCRAALARICMEGSSAGFAYSGALYANQDGLTGEDVLALGAGFASGEALGDCMDSEETAAKLRDDIDWAVANQIRGTPLILINGRRASLVPEFLYAIILAGGNAEHPAFTGLQ